MWHVVDAISVFLEKNGIQARHHKILSFSDGEKDVEGGLEIRFDAEVRAGESKYLRRQVSFRLDDTFIYKYDRQDYGRTIIARSLGESIGYERRRDWYRHEVSAYRYVVYDGVHMGENVMLTMVLSYVKGEPIKLGSREVEHKSVAMGRFPAVQLLWVDDKGHGRAKVLVTEGARPIGQIIRDLLAEDRARDATWDSGFQLSLPRAR